jgi:hypothetical protein
MKATLLGLFGKIMVWLLACAAAKAEADEAAADAGGHGIPLDSLIPPSLKLLTMSVSTTLLMMASSSMDEEEE